MSVTLNNLKKNKGTLKARKRIGRGNAAGQGTYSGRGLKGQNARAGVSNLKRLGMKQVLLRTPKLRGMKSDKPKAQVVNLTSLNKFYKENDVVDPKSLSENGLINNTKSPVKILSKGELKVEGLIFKDVKFSAAAKEKVEKVKAVIK